MRSVCHTARSKLVGRLSVAIVTVDVPPTIFLSSSVRELRSTKAGGFTNGQLNSAVMPEP